MSQAASINAVRNIARSLARPAPEFLDVIAVVKSCGLLTQELPLASTSPFGTLPDVSGKPQGSASPADPSARIDLPRRTAPAPRNAKPPAEKHDSKTAPAPSPVFSFRRRERGAEPQTRASKASQPAAIVARTIDQESRGFSPFVTFESNQLENTAAVHPAAPTIPTPISSGPPAISHPREMAGPAIELLDSLATELLAAPVLSLNSTRATDPNAASRHEETDFTRRRALPGAEMRRVQGPDASLQTPGYSLARNPVHESLSLAPLSSPYADPYMGALETPQTVHLVSQSSPVASMPRGQQVAAQSASMSPETVAASSNLDAETLASMVNEVLAEQARRHGVDLS